MSALDAHSTVGQWVAEYPQTARVFEELQIDYCCGGEQALALACGERDVQQVLSQLASAVEERPGEPAANWSQASLTELCDHIQHTHHAYLRAELPRLTDLVQKVAAAHAEKHPELSDLQSVFAELRQELEPHMFKEEQILFPAIRQLEAAANCPTFPFGTVANPIRMMKHEHDLAGGALARIRKLTGDFGVPPDACNTYRVLIDRLKCLEADMHQHIHKENNILFPRAETLEMSHASQA